MGVERVLSALFLKYKCVENWDMKLALRLALYWLRQCSKTQVALASTIDFSYGVSDNASLHKPMHTQK
jgi:hypothetical protein